MSDFETQALRNWDALAYIFGIVVIFLAAKLCMLFAIHGKLKELIEKMK